MSRIHLRILNHFLHSSFFFIKKSAFNPILQLTGLSKKSTFVVGLAILMISWLDECGSLRNYGLWYNQRLFFSRHWCKFLEFDYFFMERDNLIIFSPSFLWIVILALLLSSIAIRLRVILNLTLLDSIKNLSKLRKFSTDENKIL